MNAFDREPEWAIYAGEHMGIEYLGTSPGNSEGVISVHVRHISPVDASPYDVVGGCRMTEKGGQVDPDGLMSDQLGPHTAIDAMSSATKLEGIRTALGYKVNKVTEYTDSDEVVEAVTFSYPSVALLNKFLDNVDTSTGLRFQEHQGGKYTLVEAAEAFEQGYYLVATEQPYQTHEHGAFHVLGAMGMAGEYLETSQEFIRSVLVRSRAELELPEILGARQRSDFRGYDFLRPSHHLTRAFGFALDNTTGTIGHVVVTPTDRYLNDPLVHAHKQLYQLRNAILFEQVPSNYRDMPDYNVIMQYCASTTARYQQLEAHAAELVA